MDFQFRDVFNKDVVAELAENIFANYAKFDKTNFQTDINSKLESLSYGDRNSLIADTLHKYLPEDFAEAANILIQSLSAELECEELNGFEGFIIMPQCLFISRYGLDEFDISMNALYEMTKRFTAEMDIRPFIAKYPKKAMEYLDKLTDDSSPFARRLASEGTRPRLPLGMRLSQFVKDPTPVIQILDKLKEDSNLMVRRSVANNLNDIAKDNPKIVTDTLKRWSKIKTKEMKWLISHALRTLLKQGNKDALKLQGYSSDINIEVNDLVLKEKKIRMGDTLYFNFTVKSNEEQPVNLMIDFVIHFMKANGKTTPKVFKAFKKKLKPNEEIKFSKKQSFQPISTRKYYKGIHYIEIQINGMKYKKENFQLI